jgi:glycopeptide antibiotics resistance protein
MPASRPIQWIAIIALVVYMLVLTKNILFKKGGPRYYKNYFAREYKQYSVSQGWKKANTVPFRTINLYKKGLERHNSNAEYNIWGNLLGFLPLGLLLPLAWPWFRHGLKFLLAGFLVSLGFETAQLLTGLGIWDVDDLLLNTGGAMTGYILFWMGAKLLKHSGLN